MKSIWVRDGVGILDRHLDEFCQIANSSSPGGTEFILTSHSHCTPMLSRVYITDGQVVTPGNKDIIRLCPDPQLSAQDQASKLYDSLCGSVNDPLLQYIHCKSEFGEFSKIVLDRMPKEGNHSFVSFLQLETAYERPNMETNAYHIACHQPDFVRGGPTHFHEGYSCFFGKHNCYRPFVDDFASRSMFSLDDKVSYSIAVLFMF